MLDMPLLNQITDAAVQNYSFQGNEIAVLHINHCMENSFYFSQAMKKIFYEVIFVGVPYNDRAVDSGYDFIYYFGKNIRDSYQLYQGEKPFCSVRGDFSHAVDCLLEKAFSSDILPLLRSGKYLLIIEDGGYHYPVLKRFMKIYPEFSRQILGSVEQTTSGTLKCMEAFRDAGSYPYPCASISRSDIKMYLESCFIAHRVIEELNIFLAHANLFLDYHQILLLGYGIIGRRIARDLEHHFCKIIVYDIDPKIADTARKDGREAVPSVTSSLFSHNTILLGNVGQNSFTQEMFLAFLEGAAQLLCLASSSSQDREFRLFLDMVSGNTSLPAEVQLTGAALYKYHTVYTFQYRGKEKTILLIAEGLPVNFYRSDVISLTHSVIDLVFSQMMTIGLTMCGSARLSPGLYLLGVENGLKPFPSEQELLKLWFEKYDLIPDRTDNLFPDPHPDGDYLRMQLHEKGKFYGEKNRF